MRRGVERSGLTSKLMLDKLASFVFQPDRKVDGASIVFRLQNSVARQCGLCPFKVVVPQQVFRACATRLSQLGHVARGHLGESRRRVLGDGRRRKDYQNHFFPRLPIKSKETSTGDTDSLTGSYTRRFASGLGK